ncbi:MAG: hypothetical protein A2W31_17190 [Planctomycetes bacterium RBG_16_64_10]|nr:MAG: hypothetical protein A2W31_17190 [Planctomycetes bacterium RBG_16_64_10]
MNTRSARRPASGPVFGLVLLLLAVISYCVFSFVGQFAASIGGHPLVVATYTWGGTWAVPALLAGAGCLRLGWWVLDLSNHRAGRRSEA